MILEQHFRRIERNFLISCKKLKKLEKFFKKIFLDTKKMLFLKISLKI